MQKTLIATSTVENPRHCSGSYQAAWRVTIDGQTGLVLHSFDWDGRDIENEVVATEPAIADAVKEAMMIGDFMYPASVGFCDDGDRKDDTPAMGEARAKATAIVYEAD